MGSFFERIYKPQPAPPGFGRDRVNPEQTASFLSRIIFGWLTPLIWVGFTRPLESDDLWRLPPTQLTPFLSDKLESRFYGKKAPQKESAKEEGQDTELLLSLNNVFFWSIWPAGVLKFIAELTRTTAPLVTKALLRHLISAYSHYQFPTLTPDPPAIGVGIGLAFAVYLMQVVASLCNNHYAQITMTSGLLIRSSIIDNVFRKSLRLSARARIEHNNGQITTMISKDATRLEMSVIMVHLLWITPIQLIVGIALLVHNLGASAAVGVGVMLGLFPFQGVALGFVFYASKRVMGFTDSRVRVMQEVLHGIRVIKLFATENFYAQKILKFRLQELKMVRLMGLGLSLVMSSVAFVPIIGAIASFITYAVTGHELTADVIFSSMQLFDIIRMPLISLPMVIGSSIDAYVSLGRISKFLKAEELDEPAPIDPKSPYAIVVDGDFTWEAAKEQAPEKKETDDSSQQKKQKKRTDKSKDKEILPIVESKEGIINGGELEEHPDRKPFELKNLNLKIKKGDFVAIVGRVGSGKSSIINAMIGEMRQTRGQVVFGDRLAYVAQVSWVMNATLKDNITWYETDDAKFREVVRACCLEHDLEILPQGEQTEIGEKGINLSGGQKARVALARAAFSEAPIVLLDDPLSAVDAAVGKAILEQCLLNGPLADKTRLLVTHSLTVLPHTDYIYVMENGEITEHGTYTDLLKNGQAFSELVEEFGTAESVSHAKPKPDSTALSTSKTPLDTVNLMVDEERLTGQVTLDTYKAYLKAAGGLGWAPILLGFIVLTQGAQVAGQLVLSFWTSKSIPNFSDSDYEALYGGLGAAQAVFSFLGCFSFTLAGIRASSTLFRDGLWGVLRAPMSFYEVTPMGRIFARLSADLAKIDAEIAFTYYFLALTGSGVLGVIGLVFYAYPWLGIMFVPLGVLYWIALSFYRRTSIEVKRLDSILRSTLYASYNEALTGLSTIRAAREQKRFIDRTESAIDVQNRAGYMTITAQRWLSLRLDVLGDALVLGICLFAVGFRDTIDPSKVGLVLTYTLAVTSFLAEMVSKFAETEQDMNAVERINVYAALEPEAPPTTPDDPPPSWPQSGAVSFQNVTMSYRPGLPEVLQGVTFDVKAGEKVGIVGRTGAGKSSLLQALFRIVEVQSGSIIIDGVDIQKIGLQTLRRQLAVIPQDALLFEGTIRSNIDPESTRTDAELIEALQRAWLLPRDGAQDDGAEAKFSLDSLVGDEGSNFSAGERQLIALTRALVKASRVIVLDEATSNVDVETDSKLQRTIQTQFSSSTLLCIAHRLNTVAHYDRILAMDAGHVEEFDTPLNLYDRPDSIFRSLCDEARLTREEIVRIRTNGHQS